MPETIAGWNLPMVILMILVVGGLVIAVIAVVRTIFRRLRKHRVQPVEGGAGQQRLPNSSSG